MHSKRILFLMVILIVSLGYAWLSVFVFDDDLDAPISFQTQKRSAPPSKEKVYTQNEQAPYQAPIANKNSSPNALAEEVTLPVKFLLKGIALADDDRKDSIALIEHKGGLIEYELFAYLLNTDMQLTAIRSNEVDVEYESNTFTVKISPPNMLAPTYRKSEKSYADMLEMTPKQIGTRPRIIEHLFILTPTPYIADGKLVNPGLNPDLFAKAGFKPDDVLKTVNGKSVTIEEEFEAIKKELLSAQMLTFTVMRKGRMITLYLDIPSEALKLTVD